MPSFCQLWDYMEAERLKEESGQLDEPAVQAIRTGLNQSEDFWDQFLAVCNNAEHLSDLLDVPVSKISSWRYKIQESLDKVHKADSQPDDRTEKDTKKEMLPTGKDIPHDPQIM